MVKLYNKGAYLIDGKTILSEEEVNPKTYAKEEAKKGTIAYSILHAHNTNSNDNDLKITFDSMASHDITYVGIVQTAKASGLDTFPIPYVLTNCHNSLCAVGGTINEDDHLFGLSAAKKYGGIYVPAHMAVIHQYMRENFAGCGKMIIGSDSHTRYGALGTMAIGEGGGELVKQLLGDTYDVAYPKVVGIYLDNQVVPGVGPQDIALAIIGAVYKSGYVKNCVMEFVGPGVSSMTTDFRNGVDVMTTETTCLTSIWRTDEDTKQYLSLHGRRDDFTPLNPAGTTFYDGMVYVDLATVKPMIALPFHPSNTYEIETLNENLEDILHSVEENAKEIIQGENLHFSLTDKIENGKLHVQQGEIAGCAGGTYSNIMEAAHILEGKSCGNGEFALSVYPSSQAVNLELLKQGAMTTLTMAGASIRTAFCGPCFGAGDTPANNSLSVRHTTRNFPNREGSKPGNGQLSSVALMDARSVAATAANGGILTPATDIADGYVVPEYHFDARAYDARIFTGFDKAETKEALIEGPNIKPWPEMEALADNILLKVCSKILDPVTTTDELIPSGETSSYRSNPLGLAEFTLSRRDPEYVERSKKVMRMEADRLQGNPLLCDEYEDAVSAIQQIEGYETLDPSTVEIGSMVYAIKPGDGSAREQAASCQRVLGGLANIAQEYATKRYRSNMINWGMIPFQMKEEATMFETGDYIFVPNIREQIRLDMSHIRAFVLGKQTTEITLYISDLTPDEKQIVLDGSLINFNRKR
jgi:aconitate hydratase